MDNIPTWVAVVISSVVSLVVAILVQLVIVPWQRKKILGQSTNGEPVKFTFGDSDGEYFAKLVPSCIILTLLFVLFIRFIGKQQPQENKTSNFSRVRNENVASYQRVNGTAVTQ